MKNIKIIFCNKKHLEYAGQINHMIDMASKNKGTGIAKRTTKYIKSKIENEKAVIALSNKIVAGFCYIESWQGKEFVANSGLIVSPEFRKAGIAKKIKAKALELSKIKFPYAKIFGLTTSLAVMKINSELGYKPVTYTELTSDNEFWKGCETCQYLDILKRTYRKQCLCTAMLMDNKISVNEDSKKSKFKKGLKVYGRWLRYKRFVLLKSSVTRRRYPK